MGRARAATQQQQAIRDAALRAASEDEHRCLELDAELQKTRQSASQLLSTQAAARADAHAPPRAARDLLPGAFTGESVHFADASSGLQEGPVDVDTLLEHIRRGAVSGATLVWWPGAEEWAPLERTELVSCARVQCCSHCSRIH